MRKAQLSAEETGRASWSPGGSVAAVTATAIIAATSAAASSGLTEVTKKSILDGYEALKSLLRKKFGQTSEVVKSVDRLEQKPDRRDLQQTLGVELSEAGAENDPALLAAAQALLDMVRTLAPGVDRHIQNAMGNYIAQADRGSTATVTRSGPSGKSE